MGEHPARTHILGILQEHPGASVQDLAQRLGLTRTVTNHHLRRLAKTGRVCSIRKGRRKMHFLATPTVGQTLLGLLHLHTARHVIESLAQDPGASWRQVARKIGITPKAVRWHVKRLQNERALYVQPSMFGPGHVTILNPELRALIASRSASDTRVEQPPKEIF